VTAREEAIEAPDRECVTQPHFARLRGLRMRIPANLGTRSAVTGHSFRRAWAGRRSAATGCSLPVGAKRRVDDQVLACGSRVPSLTRNQALRDLGLKGARSARAA
jgi:hypothetical protein